ncbi:MAG: alpha amylase N-terminal ig-like domain-containing protein [Candidatus Eisenbacteria bacterium]
MSLRTPIARVALAATLACAALLSAALPAWATKVTFRYQPVIGGVSRVSVAGSFNGWKADANPMTDPDKDGVWSADIEIPAGRVQYKFVVNGDQWMTDENAAEFESDGLGGQNSVLVVTDKPVIAGYGTTVKKAPPVKAGMRRVTFSFKPDKKPDALCVAGAFNDWTVGKTPMTDPDGDGTYTTTLLLAPGSYPYKFVIGSSGWTQDKAGQDSEIDDGFGGKNSIRVVDERFPSLEVKRGDGKLFPDGIEHTQSANEVNALGGGRVQFTARAHLDDVDGVDLVTWGPAETITTMHRANTDKVFEYFRAEVKLPAGNVPYAFRYRDGTKTWWLGAKGVTEAAPEKFTFDPARFPAFTTPDWVRNGVIYQVFPDRFRNGNPANDPDFKEWYYEGKRTLPASGVLNTDFQEYYHLVRNWNDYAALTQAPHTPDHRDWMAFYGGDIEGVRQKLDYLKSLGVTILYFNPIFEAKSTHKYDAADYRKIDPHFGTNAEFVTFVKEAHAKGIKIILDIVYNHSGNSNFAFRDAVQNGESSPYWKWYEFRRWPLPAGWPSPATSWKPSDYYACWWNFGDLPDLDFDLSRDDKAEIPIKDVKDAQPNIGLVNYLLDATTYWLRDADVDGVRLDVPNEVPFWFWKLFNQRVKTVKPDAYIVGELWGNASDYVRPGVYDAVMNYAFFRDPVLKFLGMGQGTAAEFDASLSTGRLTYPMQAVEVQMNLIDSHDTVRFLTQVGGNTSRLMLAALFQMTYVGAPAIYYGDEIAMEGQRDPDCRRPFVWDWEKDPKRVAMHAWYTKLANLRLGHSALRAGEFVTRKAEGMTYLYSRTGGGEEFLVAINAGRSPQNVALDLGPWGGKVTAVDALEGGAPQAWTGTATITLAPESGRIFQLTR